MVKFGLDSGLPGRQNRNRETKEKKKRNREMVIYLYILNNGGRNIEGQTTVECLLGFSRTLKDTLSEEKKEGHGKQMNSREQ